MDSYISLKLISAALIYSILGIIILAFSFIIIDKLTPQNLWKSIVEDKNIALGIVVGSMILGIANIIAASVHG